MYNKNVSNYLQDLQTICIACNSASCNRECKFVNDQCTSVKQDPAFSHIFFISHIFFSSPSTSLLEIYGKVGFKDHFVTSFNTWKHMAENEKLTKGCAIFNACSWEWFFINLYINIPLCLIFTITNSKVLVVKKRTKKKVFQVCMKIQPV